MTPREKVQETMTKKGWSPRQIAAEAGLSHMTIREILSGKPITVRSARKLSPIVGRSVGWLVEGGE
jgi:transcriptional regulator with XRE-family HTH domain